MRSQIVNVKADDIRVDKATQRGLRPAWAKYLAENFDEDKLGVVHVSRRNGHYYAIDGQHRVFACRMRGEGTRLLECKVYEDLTKADEARRFDGLNDQKAVGAFDRFRVRLNYDDDAKAILKIITSAGLHGSGSRSGTSPLRRRYRRGPSRTRSRSLRRRSDRARIASQDSP